MNRGDQREPTFKDDADRQRFLEPLGEACACRCSAAGLDPLQERSGPHDRDAKGFFEDRCAGPRQPIALMSTPVSKTTAITSCARF